MAGVERLLLLQVHVQAYGCAFGCSGSICDGVGSNRVTLIMMTIDMLLITLIMMTIDMLLMRLRVAGGGAATRHIWHDRSCCTIDVLPATGSSSNSSSSSSSGGGSSSKWWRQQPKE